MAAAVLNALAPEAWRMAMAADGRPLWKPTMSERSEPSSVRPTSLMRTTEPSWLMRSGIAANSSGFCSRCCTMMGELRRCPGTAGAPPNWPAETSTL